MPGRYGLDVVFLVDATGSMGYLIKAVKDKIGSVTEKASQQFGNLVDLRFSVVAYRDIKDACLTEVVRFHGVGELGEFARLVGKIEAKGGGDMPEDIASGLMEVSKQEWRPLRDRRTGRTCKRVCVLLTDAPAHGRAHNGGCSSDDYPDHPRDVPKRGWPSLEDATKACLDQNIMIHMVRLGTHASTYVAATRDSLARIMDEHPKVPAPIPRLADYELARFDLDIFVNILTSSLTSSFVNDPAAMEAMRRASRMSADPQVGATYNQSSTGIDPSPVAAAAGGGGSQSVAELVGSLGGHVSSSHGSPPSSKTTPTPAPEPSAPPASSTITNDPPPKKSKPRKYSEDDEEEEPPTRSTCVLN